MEGKQRQAYGTLYSASSNESDDKAKNLVGEYSLLAFIHHMPNWLASTYAHLLITSVKILEYIAQCIDIALPDGSHAVSRDSL